MTPACDCVVIGAGIAGAASARALARAGRRVVLLGAEEAGAATPAAAGMLAPQIEAHAGDPMLPFALAARERCMAVARELAAAGHDTGLRQEGIVHVALDPAGAEELRRQADAQRALGLEAAWWDREELVRRHPHIGDEAAGASFAPRDGNLDNLALLAALLADAEAAGAAVRRSSPALEILVTGSRVAGVRTAAGTISAQTVVVAAGAWSPRLAGLPRALPVAPVRGQMALAPWPAREPRAVLFGPGGYIVPRGEHAVLGSTMEHAGFDPATTAEGIAHIRTTTGRILPPLLTFPILRTWAGLRPLTPDTRPILGHDPDVSGLLYNTGHGRNGILIGPLTGDVVRDLVVQGGTSWDLAPYAVSRFTATREAAG
jgi:glycine oxidase